MKISGIYKIQSVIKPERCYIGSAVDVNRRKRDHFEKLRNNDHVNKKLQSHYNKYSESDLLFSILLGCEKEDLIKHEQFFIDSYKPWFNVRIIAESNLGLHWKLSEKTRMIMFRKRLDGDYQVWNKGKKATAEAILHQSEAHKGKQTGENNPFFDKKHSISTKKIMSQKKRGITPPHTKTEEFSKRISELKKGNAYRKGMITSAETRKKQSEAAIRRYRLKNTG